MEYKRNIFIYILLMLISIKSQAQIGINTEEPTRTLDVNGDLRLRNLQKVNLTNDSYVLATDDAGNVEKYSAQTIIESITDLTVETKELNFATTPDGTKIVPCGKFNLRFSSGTLPQIASITGLTSAVSVNILGQLKYDSNQRVVRSFAVSVQNSNGFVNLESANTLNRVGEYYLSYPGDNNFYRIVFLARKMNATQNSYSIVCEKF